MDRDMQEFVGAVEMWVAKRKPLAEAFTMDGMREFVETHNALTRKLISLTGKFDPDFWSGVLELAQNAATMTTGGKLFVNGRDVTNL